MATPQALYPAIKAARSANPGVQRAWRMPSPTGDAFDIRFPFTVSDYDLVGVVQFLREHFRNFSDTSVITPRMPSEPASSRLTS